MKGHTLVFAYGSNLDFERMQRRVPSARFRALAALPGHVLRFHKRGSEDGTGKANAFRTDRAGDVVHGVVYEVDPDELPGLDGHEGGYHRVRVRVDDPVGGGEPLEAWTYVAKVSFVDDTLVPTRAYLGHAIRGARAHGLPDDWIAHLERTPTVD